MIPVSIANAQRKILRAIEERSALNLGLARMHLTLSNVLYGKVTAVYARKYIAECRDELRLSMARHGHSHGEINGAINTYNIYADEVLSVIDKAEKYAKETEFERSEE